MTENLQKFVFFRELSLLLKLGKINFHEVWANFGHSTVHHLEKTPKITPKLDLQKNIHFYRNPKKRKNFFGRVINVPNMSKKSKCFCQRTSHAPKHTESFFVGIETIFAKWTSDCWKNTRFYRNPDEVEILAVCFWKFSLKIAKQSIFAFLKSPSTLKKWLVFQNLPSK